jgi:hypothetical protein
MKKIAVLLVALTTAMVTQAADFMWITGQLQDFGGAHDDGGVGINNYATAGVNLYLVYNGIGGSFNPADWYYSTVSSSLSYSLGANVDTIVATYINTLTDYNDTGAFSQTITGIGLTWLGETSATWEAMNNRSFTLVAISDLDGNFASGATWNYYTGTPVGFTTAQGGNSLGVVTTPTFNVSGAGALNVVPEPATFGLMALGGGIAWLVRLKQRIG